LHILEASEMISTALSPNKTAENDILALNLRSTRNKSITKDRRCEHRNYGIFQLICKSYDFDSDTFDISGGVVKNYSDNGLYKDRLLGKCDSESAIGAHAQVVWCKILKPGFNPRYGVGARYFEPIESDVKGL
jgi:hypothetical protein